MIRLIIALTFVFSFSAPAMAQEPPSAELLREVHPAVYEAGLVAELVAKKAGENFQRDLVAYQIAAENLRKAIKDETDAAKFAVVHSEYTLRSVLLSGNGARVVGAYGKVVEAFNAHFIDEELSRRALEKHRDFEKSKK